jgi:hypothetical protein
MALAYATCVECGVISTLKLNNTGTIDSSGRLVSFSDPGAVPGTTTLGTAAASDQKNDGMIAWGRWTNGILGGDGSLAGRILAGSDSLHYIVGVPTPAADMTALNRDGVTAAYTFLGGTSPTSSLGDTGTLNGGTLTAHFGSTPKVDVSLDLSVAQRNYGITGTGLPISGSGFGGSGVATGCVSATACSADLKGFFSGAMAARAGVAYNITDLGFVSGVAAFTKH